MADDDSGTVPYTDPSVVVLVVGLSIAGFVSAHVVARHTIENPAALTISTEHPGLWPLLGPLAGLYVVIALAWGIRYKIHGENNEN